MAESTEQSRAALLPHPADPFLLKYWLKFYQTVWHDEVDKLYILINSPIDIEVIEYMKTLVAADPSIELIYVDKQLEHGAAIDLLLQHCQEKYVVLMEDDCFVFKKGYLHQEFQELESGAYEVIGSPRGSCGKEIWDEAQRKFHLDYSGYGDVGPNFWPAFLFTTKEILLSTDRYFGAKSWSRGEVIEPLEYVVQEEVCPGDTFVNTSLQLRAKGYKIKQIPQYHGSPDDLEHFEMQTNLFDGKAPWVHVGSLSSGVHGVLIDDKGRALGKRNVMEPVEKPQVPGTCNSDGERKEWERRVAFWQLFYENSDPMAIVIFRDLYLQAINRVINQFGLSPKKIEMRKMAYHTLGL